MTKNILYTLEIRSFLDIFFSSYELCLFKFTILISFVVKRLKSFYDLFLDGVLGENVPLLNNDRIFIPPRTNEIRIQGPVRRAAIYELKEGETLEDLVEFAGGLRPETYSDRMQINRIIPMFERSDPSRAREVLDVRLTEALSGDAPLNRKDGDRIQLFSITYIILSCYKYCKCQYF